MGIAGCRWYLPINGTRSSKAMIATLMTDVAGREDSNQSPQDGCQ
jgi:hypothetical protein